MGGDEAETHAAAQQDYRRRGCGLWRCITIYSSNPVVLRASLMQQKHNNAVSAKKQNKKTGLKWNETQKYANISSWIQNIDLIFSFFCFTVRTPFIAAEMEERKRKLRRERGFKGWSHKKKKSYAHSLKRCSDIIAHSQKRSSAVCIAMTTESPMLMDFPDLLFIHPSPHYSFIRTHMLTHVQPSKHTS